MSWPPHITVAVIVFRDNKFLMVEEIRNNQCVYNQPAGHLEPNETLAQAAVREAYEETGWHVAPTHFLGVTRYVSTHSDTVYYRHTFIAEALTHDLDATLDEGIVQSLWLSYDELCAAPDKCRSPLVLKNIEQFLAGERYPLQLIDDAS